MKPLEGKTVVLMTKHEKERVIKSLMESETGCKIIVDSKYNTDRLGTFSREVKRRRTQLKTARVKAKKALKRTDADYAIVSEGSFGAHPMAPIPWNMEMVLLMDRKTKREIVGFYETGETNFNHKLLSSFDELVAFAKDVGFPDHGLIVRPDHENHKKPIKGLTSYEKLKSAFEYCMAMSKKGRVYVETDMRAHLNPLRMASIEKATENLISKLNQVCPKCGFPGFEISRAESGLPCNWCGDPTDLTLKHISLCKKCGYQAETLYPNGQTASPEYCHRCNP